MSNSYKLSSLSVFMPCFNESPNIPAMVRQFSSLLPHICRRSEIIIINDGSTDDTVKVVNQLQKKYPQLKLVNHSQNLGYGAALQSGIKTAQYDWVFFTDGDIQFRITELKNFIPYTQKYAFIIGYRKNRAEGSLRALNARIFKLFIDLIFRVHVKDIDCAFKLFRANIIKPLPLQSTGAMISAELLYRLKKQHVTFKQLPVTHQPRRYGSPTGNKPSVIIKAGIEAVKLYLGIKLNLSAK